MDSLRPERDEVDRFNRSRAATRLRNASADSKSQVASPKTGAMSWVLLVLLLVVVAGSAWVFVGQQAKINHLENSFKETESLLRQSKLMMARFEGALSETGQEMQQSGSAVSDKLKFLDSEVRKLWGVSNDRNKKSIAANRSELDALTGNVARLKKSIDESDKKLKRLRLDVDKQMQLIAANDKETASKIKELSSQVALASSDISITRTELGVQIEDVKNMVPDITKVQAQLDENNTAIKAIDASRVQLNERVVDLETKINKLLLQSRSATAK